MNEKVIETEERPNDNLVQKPRAMMSSHVTQMLAIIDMFIKTMWERMIWICSSTQLKGTLERLSAHYLAVRSTDLLFWFSLITSIHWNKTNLLD